MSKVEDTFEVFDEDTTAPAITHSYGLRLAPPNPEEKRRENLYVVVRVDNGEEEVLSRPEYRGLAVEILYEHILSESWDSNDVDDVVEFS